MKKIVILGSTGSIGDSALKVVSSSGGNLKVLALSADSSTDKLFSQIRKYRPKAVGIVNERSYHDFSGKYGKRAWKLNVKVHSGPESLQKLACMKGADLLLSAVVGAVGLKALLAALKMGRTVALANKESLIMAGDLVTRTAKRYGARLLPVDSEHSAMFQCIQGQNGNRIEKIILTASGGPFYRYRGSLAKVSVEKALAHPNWKMGRKITVDSATLMNKGLEAIEAHYLFGVPLDRIQIVIHRQSIVHSAVEFEDGSILAQLSHPDMCLPIQYALTWPGRNPCPIKRLNFSDMKRLDFEAPDFDRFPCLRLALRAGKKGGTSPAVLSASNETAVAAFLNRRIRFTDIAKIVEEVLMKEQKEPNPGLDEILESDRWARRKANEVISRIEK